MKNEPNEREAIEESLIQYYEAAGFEDVYNRMLKNLTDTEIWELYQKTINLGET